MAAAPRFSGAVLLSDLNDYISPGQVCVNPTKATSGTGSGANSAPAASADVRVDDTGRYYEVTRDGTEEKLVTAEISLSDCLACSGCITSTESVLVNMQSHKETYSVVAANRAATASGDLSPVRHVVFSVSSQSRASLAAAHSLTPLQVARRVTHFLRRVVGVDAVYDTNFARDFALLEQAREFVERWKQREKKQTHTLQLASQGNGGYLMEPCDNVAAVRVQPSKATGVEGAAPNGGTALDDNCRLPMLASACPGWICYAEKTHGHLLPYISETKSPQQVMGSLVKEQLASEAGLTPNQIYHVAVMPCYDKKLEASRGDFYSELYRTRDVDCVITTRELELMFQEQGMSIEAMEEEDLDRPFTKFWGPNCDQLARVEGSSSGAYLHSVMRLSARELFGIHNLCPTSEGNGVVVKHGRNADFMEVILEINGEEKLRFAAAYGLRNTQNLVRKLKIVAPSRSSRNTRLYDFVEVMACPSGCINGGGQLPAPDSSPSAREWIAEVDRVYKTDPAEWVDENLDAAKALFDRWVGGVGSEKARRMLRTQYHAVEKTDVTGLGVKW